MISTKTHYKTNNNEFLVIIQAFKTWRHYLKDYKHEFFIFTDHINLRCFMDTKNLGS